MQQSLPLFGQSEPTKTPVWSLRDVFEKLEMPLVPVLLSMERRGIRLDTDFLSILATKVRAEQEKLSQKIIEQAGSSFNLNSTQQLAKILFTDLGLKPGKKSKNGFSTDASTLEKLKSAHPIIPLLLQYRQNEKLLTTYIEPMPALINNKTGRIHTSYNQAVTTTGRLSSSKPNLQNIPIRTEIGNEIRKAFIPAEGYVLASLDYSQIELRIVAHVAQDTQMIADFQAGKDIHATTAARLFRCNIEEVSKQQRRIAKAINFATIYGAGPRNLAENAGVSVDEAKSFIETYFATYTAVHQCIETLKESARTKGYAETLFGRNLPIPDMTSHLPQMKAAAERLSVNMPFQGTAADILKLAMIKVFAQIKDKPDEIGMLLQVHDELVFEIRSEKVDHYVPLLKEILEQIVPLDVPLVVDVGVGTSWGSLYPLS